MLGHPGGAQTWAAAPPHVQTHASDLGAPGEVFQAFPTWWRPPEDQNILERLFLPAGPEEP